MSEDSQAPAEDVKVMTFREHLAELRSRLVRIAIALVIGFFLGWEYRREIFDFLSSPITEALADNGIYSYQAISITESIIVYLKSVFITDLLVMSPIIFWQLWAFVSPGLLAHERRFVLPVTAFSVVFFFVGSAFAYQVIIPFITDWLVKLTVEDQVSMLVTLQNAYSFAFTFLLMFGLVFQLPLVIYFLALFGTVTHRGLLRFWRYFAVLSFLISALLTPPDPLSQVLMAVPLNALYGLGILVAMAVERTRRKAEKVEGMRVGVTSLKLMGSAVVLIVVVAVMVIFFIRSLPERELVTFAPARAQWVVGLNPAALAEQAPFSKELGADSEGSFAARLRAGGIELSEITDALVIGTEDGARAVIVRADGLGGQREALQTVLNPPPPAAPAGKTKGAPPPPQPAGERFEVVALDDHTLAFGRAALVAEIVATANGDAAPAATRDEEETRLVKRLRLSGPVWAWAPKAAERSAALLGARVAEDTHTVGAWLEIAERSRFSLELNAADARADLLEARLDAARNASSAAQNSHELVLLTALDAIAAEVEQTAPDAAARQRLAAVRATLDTMRQRPTELEVPLIRVVGASSSGWALRRNADWVTVTTELDAKAVETLMLRLVETDAYRDTSP